MSTEARYRWQDTHNYLLIGLRTRAPEEGAPFTLRVRPQDYYTYFETEHDWCDPFHQNAAGDCRAANHHLVAPTLLRAQKNGDILVWQIDTWIGAFGAMEEDWRRQTEPTLFSTYEAPTYRPGAATLHVSPLPERLRVSLVCE